MIPLHLLHNPMEGLLEGIWEELLCIFHRLPCPMRGHHLGNSPVKFAVAGNNALPVYVAVFGASAENI